MTTKTCRNCGAPLDRSSGYLLCPACMLRDVLTLDPNQADGGPFSPLALPCQLGKYELLEEIGRGGMGVVYAARQPALDRMVAVKVIKIGMDTKEVITRFEVERHALAMMEHPNIARVFDAGATPDGRPYFVMELLEGVPLMEYCDDNCLPTRERLQLFSAICRAVQHAHQKGIIHRDLKPSNILVSPNDGEPVLKIIDFGVAKATRGRLTDTTQLTQLRSFVGTPAYTSPEQMELNGLDVDTRSDIYSLGVVLYELITGRTPFDADALAQSSFDSMRHTIREVDPPRPSTRLGKLTREDLAWIARRHGTDPGRLLSELRGDLDSIVMHCLEKEPSRRYATANGLALDIDRHLRNEPIEAHPPGRIYRTRTFIRRHMFSVFATVAILCSLIAGLIASSILLVRERAAYEREALARQHALAAEAAESRLRKEAELSRAAEAKRSSMTSVQMAGRLLEDDKSAEALARLVHAASIDPANPVVVPRLLSLLASRSYLVPAGEPLDLGAGIHATVFTPDGNGILALGVDGSIAVQDIKSGEVTRTRLPSPPVLEGLPGAGHGWLACLCQDGVLRAIDCRTGQIAAFIQLDSPGEWAVGSGYNSPPAYAYQSYKSRLRDGGNPLRPHPLASRWADRNDLAMVVKLQDGTWVMVDILSGRIRPLPSIEKGKAFCFTGGSRWFVQTEILDGEGTGLVRIWDLEAGRERHHITLQHLLPRALELLIVPSPDLDYFIAVTRSVLKPIETQVWSVSGGVPRGPRQALEKSPYLYPSAIHFSPDKMYFSLTTLEGSRVYRAADGKKVGPFYPCPQQNGNPVLGKFSPGGSGVLVADDARLQWHDILTGTPLDHAITEGNVPARSVDFSRDGTVLRTIGFDHTIRVWDASTGRRMAEAFDDHLSDAIDVVLSPDGHYLLLAQRNGFIRRLTVSGDGIQPLLLPRWNPIPAPFLPHQPARLFWIGYDGASFIDIATGQMTDFSLQVPLPEVTEAGQFTWLAADPNGHSIVGRIVAGLWQVWVLEAGQIVPPLPLQDSFEVNSVSKFSHDGTLLAIGHRDEGNTGKTLRVWRLSSGEVVCTLKVSEDSIPMGSSAWPWTFNRDGRLLAAGSVHGSIYLWDLPTGNLIRRWELEKSIPVRTIEFSRDDSRLVAGDMDGNLRIWNTLTGEPCSPVVPLEGPIRQARFSPDGRYLLVNHSGQARILDGNNGTPVSRPASITEDFRSGAFGPDSRRYLLTTNAAQSVQVLDTQSSLPLSEPMKHDFRVPGGEFSPDGRFICSETANTSEIRFHFWLWPVAPDGGSDPVPEWLLDLATLYSGGIIDGSGNYVPVPPGGPTIDDVRRKVESLPHDSRAADWGRWILDDSPNRSIGPGFLITPAEATELYNKLNNHGAD